jgi:glyoxylate/hydroxypyruvate reductase
MSVRHVPKPRPHPLHRPVPAMTLPSPILLIMPVPAQAAPMAAAVQALAPEVELIVWQRDLPDEPLARVRVLLGWRFPAALAGRLPRLRWVCASAAGVDKLLVPELPAGVPVSRIVDPDQALGIAQYVATVALAHVRELPRYQAQQLARQWVRHPMGAARHRVGVLGYGEVGQEIGRVLGALGFAVQGWRRSGPPLHRFLAGCDIVVNALPLTPQTEGLLDAAALAAMPRGGYLVNIARGGHVVEADLVAALQSGHLAGAALDVQQNEPLPADDPLWSAPGVLVTPHIAGQSLPATVAAQFVAGLQALARGEAPPNPVDRDRGY